MKKKKQVSLLLTGIESKKNVENTYIFIINENLYIGSCVEFLKIVPTKFLFS